MEDGFAADRHAAFAVGHQSLTLGGADGRAQIGLAAETGLALATFGNVERDDVVADFEALHVFTHFHHHAGAFVAKHAGEESFGVFARESEGVGMADAGGLNFHHDLVGAGCVQVDFYDFKGCAGFYGESCASFHKSPFSGDWSESLGKVWRCSRRFY